MVTLLLDSAQLEVVLSPVERAFAFRRGSLRIDRASIERVQLTDDAWTWLRGVPTPGTHVPRVMAMGTWKSAGGSDFVIVQRNKPAVVIDLAETDGSPIEFQRVVLSTRHGLALVQALRRDADVGPVDVAEITTGAVSAPGSEKPRARRPRSVRPRPGTAPAT
ncbi:hypothetical protein [Microbacterium sp. TNHR37B]|uniref:hypothetical protein n=1 Tax=Microbacterium sp. TNHR37B TaxID=1775956 RepID=UPI000834DD3A|nr:hypothetical protein [Microbacterium sp. TNHR37B]